MVKQLVWATCRGGHAARPRDVLHGCPPSHIYHEHNNVNNVFGIRAGADTLLGPEMCSTDAHLPTYITKITTLTTCLEYVQGRTRC